MSKIILITGASKGIGRFLAAYYAKLGNQVIGVSRSESDYTDPNYVHMQVDITKEEEVVSLFKTIKRLYGSLDVLINNAGVASMNHAILTPSKTLDKLFSTNFYGTFFCCREAAKLMLKKRSGRIVNTSTIAVPMVVEGEAIYAASKSAVETFTKVLAKELGVYNITCNAVGPTPIMTDLIKNVPKDKIQKIIDNLSIKRLGEYSDVANVIDFFIHENSNYITGQIVYLGGA